MAIVLAEVARRLRELIAALDRRVPRLERAAEAAIARDAAALRESAVNRLEEIAGLSRVTPAIQTAFPVTPADVAELALHEFMPEFDTLDGNRPPSMDDVCRTFMDDANRALVWWIRFGALKSWCAATDAKVRLATMHGTYRDACEVAAGFPLNHRWEFDPDDFSSAIDSAMRRRPPQRD